MEHNFTFYFVGSFVIGASFLSLWDTRLISVAIIFAGVILVYAYYRSRSRVFAMLLLICFGFLLGMFRFDIESMRTVDVLDDYLEREEVFGGIIIDEPSSRERSTRIIVAVDTVSDVSLARTAKLITSVSRFEDFKYGDRVELSGQLERPSNFANERGREFDYVHYLAKDKIYYTLSFPEAVYVSSGNGNRIKHALFRIKHAWLGSVQELIPDPHVSLLGGLVVGAKESLGEDLEDDFRRTGIIHIVVLSGYNVTIVAEAIMHFFGFLPHLLKLSFGASTIVFFAILTGASATIVRASIMALLVVLARATNRTSEAGHALCVAGFFMVLQNPMIVLYDPSFQLSFLATIGLIYVSPIIGKYFTLIPKSFHLREFAIATVATQLFVLPLLVYMMGEVSLVALPVNVLVLALIPLTMLFGFLAGVVGVISATLAFPFTAITYFLLSYELFIVKIFASIPSASVEVPSISIWIVLFVYFVYVIICIRKSHQ